MIEPEKQLLREHEAAQKIPRILIIVGIDSKPDGGFSALVNLTEDKVDVERVSEQAQVHEGLLLQIVVHVHQYPGN